MLMVIPNRRRPKEHLDIAGFVGMFEGNAKVRG